MSSTRFLQGIFDFERSGLHEPFLLDRRLSYTVPAGNEAQFVYFRGGNSSSELVCANAMRDGSRCATSRSAPRATRTSRCASSRTCSPRRRSMHLAAPAGASGQIVIDVGLVEI